MKVGFIGVGIMGSGMARNLLKAGYDVTVYNRTRSKAESLSSEGANIADEPVDVAKISDILITVLEGDKSEISFPIFHSLYEIVIESDPSQAN